MVISGIETFLFRYMDDMIYIVTKYRNLPVFTGLGVALSLA